MKSIAFAGSSMTWGQGLHYYSDLPNIVIGTDNFDRFELTDEHIEFIKKYRFSRLVADEFNTTDIVRNENGGTTKLILDFLNNDVDLSKCDYIVIQFTDAFRDFGKFYYKGEERLINIKVLSSIYESEFDKYIMENWNYNLDEYIDFYLKEQVEIVAENIRKFENLGVKKCFVLNETNEFYKYFKQNEFFKNRIINLKINDFFYDTIEEALIAGKLKIIKDDINIIEKYGREINDRHLTLEGHNIIAQNIINVIKNHIYEYEN
jgi:hypothetical protein